MRGSVDPAAISERLPPQADGSRPEVRDLEVMIGGASSEIWSFVAGDAPPLVLRRSVNPTPTARSIATQATAMQAAASVGVPVPTVVAWGEEDPDLGSWLVMTKVEGETIARRIQRDDLYAPARRRFASQCGEVLARLHRVDPAVVVGVETPGDPLDTLRERLDTLAAPSATFEWAIRHLDERRPASRPATLVHGDFRLGNLLIGPEGIRAVLDWEGVHVGNPVEDLGWVCTTAWRFGGVLPVGGFGSREELCDAYHRAGGAAVSVEELRWWEALGSLRWGVICMEQASRHFHGYPSVELAAIGRRVAEVEWDLLGILP